VVKLGGSGSFRVSGGIVGRLGFRDGVSASYSNFRRVGNFDISHTAAVWLSPAKNLSSTGNATLKPNITSIGKPVAKTSVTISS